MSFELTVLPRLHYVRDRTKPRLFQAVNLHTYKHVQAATCLTVRFETFSNSLIALELHAGDDATFETTG